MKFGQFISVILLAAIVGIASNVAFSYLSTEKQSDDEIKFEKFLSENWEDGLEKNPYFASLLGDKRFDDKVSSNSQFAFYENRDYEEYVISVLDSINPENLSDENKLNYRLIRLDYEVSLEGRKYPSFYMRLNQRGGVQDYYDYANRLNFATESDYLNWFERVKGYTQNVKNSLINKIGRAHV